MYVAKVAQVCCDNSDDNVVMLDVCIYGVCFYTYFIDGMMYKR